MEMALAALLVSSLTCVGLLALWAATSSRLLGLVRTAHEKTGPCAGHGPVLFSNFKHSRP
jgi:hypothetical protein